MAVAFGPTLLRRVVATTICVVLLATAAALVAVFGWSVASTDCTTSRHCYDYCHYRQRLGGVALEVEQEKPAVESMSNHRVGSLQTDA